MNESIRPIDALHKFRSLQRSGRSSEVGIATVRASLSIINLGIAYIFAREAANNFSQGERYSAIVECINAIIFLAISAGIVYDSKKHKK